MKVATKRPPHPNINSSTSNPIGRSIPIGPTTSNIPAIPEDLLRVNSTSRLLECLRKWEVQVSAREVLSEEVCDLGFHRDQVSSVT